MNSIVQGGLNNIVVLGGLNNIVVYGGLNNIVVQGGFNEYCPDYLEFQDFEPAQGFLFKPCS